MLNKKPLALAIALLLLAGCATDKKPANVEKAGETQQQVLVKSLEQLTRQRAADPDNVELKSREQIDTSILVNLYLNQAEQALKQNEYAEASRLWRTVLTYQSGNSRAAQGLRRIGTYRALDATYLQAVKLASQDPERALQKIQLVLEEEPNWPQGKALRDHLMRKLSSSNVPYEKMDAELKKQISLNFQSHNLIDIFSTVSKMTGINIIYDNDVPRSATASIIARKTTAEDAINLLLLTNQLRKKVLNGNTLLIYPAGQSKDKTYRNIEVKTFFLGYAKAKDVNVALRNMLKIKDIHVDERTNTITVRAPAETVDMAERLLITLDRPDAEVTLEVQVLEVSTNDAKALGIDYPDKIGLSVGNSSESSEKSKSSGSSIPLSGFKAGNLYVRLGESGGIAINLKDLVSKATVLANPRIRVKNGKKAEIHIGEKIPVVSSTLGEYGNTSKVEYNEIGLKLMVTPDISLDGTITMDVDFDLSNLGNEVKAANGEIYYKTTNRKAKTILSSENGETQILAGLIKQDKLESDQGLPWFSHIPLVGGLFGSHSHSDTRTEVILLITPRLEHNIDLPGGHVSTIQLGTEDLPGEQNVILRANGKIKLNEEQFPQPDYAPAAHMPESLPDPNQGAREASGS